MKKPELYTQQKLYGNSDTRVRLKWDKIAIWNTLYYRSKGKRKAYVIKERKPSSYNLYGSKPYRYTRWQLDYDLTKPWHVDARFPKDFATHAEAIEYAFSLEATEGPFKYSLNTKLAQHTLWSGENIDD
jgi:hypothetical protein